MYQHTLSKMPYILQLYKTNNFCIEIAIVYCNNFSYQGTTHSLQFSFRDLKWVILGDLCTKTFLWCVWLYGQTFYREPTIWLYNLCLRVLTVHVNELRLYVSQVISSKSIIYVTQLTWADTRTYLTTNGCATCYIRVAGLNLLLHSKNM